jgi:hypothetical protein
MLNALRQGAVKKTDYSVSLGNIITQQAKQNALALNGIIKCG